MASPLPPFHEAVQRLQNFLERENNVREVEWIFREDVLSIGQQIYLNGRHPQRSDLAKAFYAEAVHQGGGINICTLCLNGSVVCCYLRHIEQGISISVLDDLRSSKAKVAESSYRWAWLKARSRLHRWNRWLEEIPFAESGHAETSTTRTPILDISQFRIRAPRSNEYWKIEVRHRDEISWRFGWKTFSETLRMWESAPSPSMQEDRFLKRNPYNIPGPFYGAMTDTCLTGPYEAPHNVMVDGGGEEFVYRQPRTTSQLVQVMRAAYVDPFSGYRVDGDSHWTLSLIREWWRGRETLLSQHQQLEECNEPAAIFRWKAFWEAGAEDYLRQYAYFVEERRLPTPSCPLPHL